jgi:hypothetical protein
MKKALAACTMVMFLAAFSGDLRAAELELHAGYLSQDEALGNDGSPIFGLRFGGGPRRLLSGETSLSYSPQEFFHLIFLEGDFSINVPVGHNIVPYVTVGPGTAFYIPKDKAESDLDIALNTSVNFSLNYGGGVRYFFNEFMGLRGDFRDHVVFSLDLDATAQSPEDVIDIGTVHLIEVSGGLTLAFF